MECAAAAAAAAAPLAAAEKRNLGGLRCVRSALVRRLVQLSSVGRCCVRGEECGRMRQLLLRMVHALLFWAKAQQAQLQGAAAGASTGAGPPPKAFCCSNASKQMESADCEEQERRRKKRSACAQEDALQEKAFRICRDYLHGAWKDVAKHEIQVQPVSGGLSNWLYLCALPSWRCPRNGEPAQVLLRMYGQVHAEGTEAGAVEALITESVIFTLLSERQLGPRLYGVFPGGRLEEYIPARPLKTQELQDPQLSRLIAAKMAQVHSMNVPISKEPRWLWDTMARWMRNAQETQPSWGDSPVTRGLAALPLVQEMAWLKTFLKEVGSPVLFCHNDLQEGNILLRETAPDKENGQDGEDMVLIDFEYCSYNYRGFDLANHFCEWMYDYTLPSPPHFSASPHNYPSRCQQLNFIRAYLVCMARHRQDEQQELGNNIQGLLSSSSEKECQEEAALLREVLAFTLASHFFWGLWSIVNAPASQIPFGYWEYAAERFEAYFQEKKIVLEAWSAEEAVAMKKRKADTME